MSSLAGALDPVEREPKSEPPLDDAPMSADEDAVGEENKVQDEEMQDLFGEGDENVEEIKHNEYVCCIVHTRLSWSSLARPSLKHCSGHPGLV